MTAFHLLQVVASAAAWRDIAGPMPRRPALGFYCVLRWVREAVNNLLPVAQIGGEFVAARLLQRRAVPLAPAIAGTVADLTTEMVTQILFTLLGLGLLLHGVGGQGLSRLCGRFRPGRRAARRRVPRRRNGSASPWCSKRR